MHRNTHQSVASPISLPLAAILLLTACGAPATPPTTHTPSPTPEPRAVTFTTGHGITLSGTLYGVGSTAVIFSHMSQGSRSEWGDLPGKVADRGYMALAYDFRGSGESEGSFNPPVAAEDLLAAIAFAREQGAKEIVLAGASMGAMASAKAAALVKPTALVFIAGTTSWRGLSVSDAELQATDAPKLFISSEGDSYIEGTLHLYEAAAPPKEKHIYPGSAHGTDLFNEFGDDLTARILEFIEKHAPAGP